MDERALDEAIAHLSDVAAREQVERRREQFVTTIRSLRLSKILLRNPFVNTPDDVVVPDTFPEDWTE